MDEPTSHTPPKKPSPLLVWARCICFCLAWLCWIACVLMAGLAILTFFDPGPHGSFGMLSVILIFPIMICAGLGWMFYDSGRSIR